MVCIAPSRFQRQSFVGQSRQIVRLALFTIAASLCCSTLQARVPRSTIKAATEFWRQAAASDVRAAHQLISSNHPAMLPEVRDPTFRDEEARAYAIATARAQRITSYDGYIATLAAYATAMKDGHIWSRPNYVVSRPDWAGLILAKRAEAWVVVDEENTGGRGRLVGANLIACDGLPTETMAERNLGAFRVDWTVGAQQIHAAPWLLIDEHNPFVDRPKTCIFSLTGVTKSVDLQWSSIKRDVLIPRINAAIGAGAAGFGIRKVGAGYWIALQDLQDAAAPVVAEVTSRQDELRQAPFVVIDLRGNHGGSSEFGTRIAQALVGRALVDATASPDDGCDEVWRTSDGNIARLQYYVDVMGPTHGPQFTEAVTKMLVQAKAARAAGRNLSGPATCAAATPPTHPAVTKSLMLGRLVLITDSTCFSSCLVVTHDLVALGALHLGQVTDANTHYSEVREEDMPSGLSKFSTLQAFSPGTPIRYGPFTPTTLYPGDISDTAALERWVQDQISRPTSRVGSDGSKSE